MSFNMDNARIQSRGSDSELAYASPVAPYWKGKAFMAGGDYRRPQPFDLAYYEGIQPRAYRTEAGIIGDDGRKRRCLGCSDDKGDLIDGFTNEVHRVGGPYLCSIPIQTIENYSPHVIVSRVQIPKNKIIKTIYEILKKHEIEPYCPVKFVGRRSCFNPEPQPTFTCLIYCTGINHTWLNASKDIRQFLRFEKMRDVSVEIIHPGYESPRYTFPIQKDDRIAGLWSEVRREIAATIDSKDVISFGCYRRGRSKDLKHTIPTVLVLVSSRSVLEWKTTREQIVAILDKFKYPEVAVEIAKDEIRTDPSKSGGVNRALLSSGMAKVGQSIAPSRNKNESWSLGGFIELLSPDGEWCMYGLTCFHCVVPDAKSVPSSLVPKIKEWREKGIEAMDNKIQEYLTVDQPTIRALKNQRKRVELQLDTGFPNRDPYPTTYVEGVGKAAKIDLSLPFRQPAREAKKFLDELDNFHKDRGRKLGFVGMGSGMNQTIKKSSTWGDTGDRWKVKVEWALIELYDERLPNNAVDSGFLRDFPDDHDRDLTDGPLYLLGHGSGALTKGDFNPLADVVYDRGENGEQRTLASTVVGIGSDRFSAPGDTGSLVFTREKYVVGMVNARTYFNSITYFMRIEDIYQHIINHTSTGEVRMYQG
ncbi:uncharacterized protein N7483_010068 [Penicillium malachiteum]|uniref:uncharacterized protein n=1 Tax=Penicillium malachiteum TaxID=1324776 RepID=UPI0025488B51|nr:uncharacterized protein N7483_010068 [Penicillium malachiteum]KAJ5712887.1 hypothetical protein N7483_010068 [Penicillium malachiteum]